MVRPGNRHDAYGGEGVPWKLGRTPTHERADECGRSDGEHYALCWCKGGRLIYIGCPAYDGKLHWTTVAGLVNVSRLCWEKKIGFALDVIPGDAFESKARSVIVQRFMASGATDLLFVDADVGFDAQGVIDVCRAEPAIVMCLYKMKMPPPARYPALLFDPIIRHPSDSNLIKLQYGPAGFMRIRREVFEKMIAKWPDEYYVNTGAQKVYDFFPAGRFGNHFIGEDMQFCNRAHECGFDIWAMQNIRLKHSGDNCWESEWAIDVLQIDEARKEAA